MAKIDDNDGKEIHMIELKAKQETFEKIFDNYQRNVAKDIQRHEECIEELYTLNQEAISKMNDINQEAISKMNDINNTVVLHKSVIEVSMSKMELALINQIDKAFEQRGRNWTTYILIAIALLQLIAYFIIKQ